MWKFLLLLAANAASSLRPCKEGSVYNSEFDSCYKVMHQSEDYSTAEKSCIQEGGHLASIHNEEENSFITGLVNSSGNPEYYAYWIGAVENDSSEWEWTDGSSFNYTNWAYGQHTFNGCTALIPFKGLWIKVQCSNHPYTTFICKIAPRPCLETLYSYCDSEWTYFQETDSCYKGFFNGTWSQAEDICVSYDSHLASIHSDKENQFIFDLVTKGDILPNSHTAMTWFGLNLVDEQWVYTDLTKYDYSRWATREPRPTYSEGCVVLTTDLRFVYDWNQKKYLNYTTRWTDAKCDEGQRRFVCKKTAYHG